MPSKEKKDLQKGLRRKKNTPYVPKGTKKVIQAKVKDELIMGGITADIEKAVSSTPVLTEEGVWAYQMELTQATSDWQKYESDLRFHLMQPEKVEKLTVTNWRTGEVEGNSHPSMLNMWEILTDCAAEVLYLTRNGRDVTDVIVTGITKIDNQSRDYTVIRYFDLPYGTQVYPMNKRLWKINTGLYAFSESMSGYTLQMGKAKRRVNIKTVKSTLAQASVMEKKLYFDLMKKFWEDGEWEKEEDLPTVRRTYTMVNIDVATKLLCSHKALFNGSGLPCGPAMIRLMAAVGTNESTGRWNTNSANIGKISLQELSAFLHCDEDIASLTLQGLSDADALRFEEKEGGTVVFKLNESLCWIGSKDKRGQYTAEIEADQSEMMSKTGSSYTAYVKIDCTHDALAMWSSLTATSLDAAAVLFTLAVTYRGEYIKHNKKSDLKGITRASSFVWIGNRYVSITLSELKKWLGWKDKNRFEKALKALKDSGLIDLKTVYNQKTQYPVISASVAFVGDETPEEDVSNRLQKKKANIRYHKMYALKRGEKAQSIMERTGRNWKEIKEILLQYPEDLWSWIIDVLALAPHPVQVEKAVKAFQCFIEKVTDLTAEKIKEAFTEEHSNWTQWKKLPIISPI